MARKITDIDRMKELLSKNEVTLESASVELRDNEEIVTYALQKKVFDAYNLASERLKSKENIITLALQTNGINIKYVPDKYKNDKKYVKMAVKSNGVALTYVDNSMYDDELIKIAVKDSFEVLEIVPKKYSEDKEFMYSIIKEDGMAYEYASPKLRDDREFTLTAIEDYSMALEYASPRLQNDKEIVLAAVSSDGRALEYASSQLKNDKEVVLTAVSEEGLALVYASSEMRNDKEIVYTAIQNTNQAYFYASLALQEDVDVAIEYLKAGGDRVHASLLNNRDYYKKAVVIDYNIIDTLSEELSKDKKFIKELIEINPKVIRCKKFRYDYELLLYAIEKDAYIFRYSPIGLQSDNDFIAECYKRNSDVLKILRDLKKFSFGQNAFQYEKLIMRIAIDNPEVIDSIRVVGYRKILKEKLAAKMSSIDNEFRYEKFINTLRFELPTDAEVTDLITALKSKESYDSIVETLASLYTFSTSKVVRDKAEEYLKFLEFDMSKIDEVLY